MHNFVNILRLVPCTLLSCTIDGILGTQENMNFIYFWRGHENGLFYLICKYFFSVGKRLVGDKEKAEERKGMSN